jgi:hypothetical protein
VRILHRVVITQPGRTRPSIGRTQCQAAFMAKRNTYEQAMLLQMVQVVYKESHSVKKLLIGAFLDIWKAYDSMEYDELLDILEQAHQSPKHLLEVLRKLLPGNRTTIMGITVFLFRGLPQGGEICPLLCNAFMEDLARDLEAHMKQHPRLGKIWREQQVRCTQNGGGHKWKLEKL